MASVLPSSVNYPPAFLCSLTGQVMEEPVMALCGHLFERSVTSQTSNCPLDGRVLDSEMLVPFSELQKTIRTWRATLPSYKRALSAAAAGGGDLSQRVSALSLKEPFRPSAMIRNAHQDDIHGLILHERGFVSGSKDTTLKIWDMSEKTSETLSPSCGAKTKTYASWITSISQLSKGFWASGTRDRHVSIWRGNQEIAHHTYQTRHQAICKQRNEQRVLCITELASDSDRLLCYVGSPQEIQLVQFSLRGQAPQSRSLTSYSASENDWVYCMELINERDLLVVIGTDLEHWDMSGEEPIKRPIIHVNRTPGERHQRPFISAIKRLEGDPNCLATAVFGGMVDLIDLTTQARIQRFHAHQKRVWAIENIRQDVIASCSDDRTIQLYDVRKGSPFYSFVAGEGRVSNLLRVDENSLISASCPDNVFESAEKASISFWDIRKLPQSA